MKVLRIFSASGISLRRSSRRSLSHILLLPLLVSGLYNSSAQAQNAVVLVGSGSSVPGPLYNRWTQDYGKRNPKIQMRYVPIGTSEGIKEISRGASDFGAGESQLTEKEKKEGGLIELPVVLIGIVPVYNLPDIQGLRLSGEVLAGIFLGDVKMWNAPQIAKLNPNIALPNLPIRVVNRPAGKGSNYVFTEFLSKASSRFRSQIGITPSPKWPVGEPAERSSDMADKVKNNPGSIGYVEYKYAVKGEISQAAVENPSGKFVKASIETIAAACQSAEAPRWNNFSASLTNVPGADAFPITSFTWIYLRSPSAGSGRASALSDFLDWIYTDGQKSAVQEGYSALPPELLAAVMKKVKALQ
ncbi:MAG TPA: phosphate ABC transporter substrate-binding protein PstS [Candidatus Acidoferrales bacterium]|jgi:phosphate transport system substrate-binding protein|nr:phosphate ABC transporter substrate-binding protein PstS [Candidatus Acidoferrales bacterium]